MAQSSKDGLFFFPPAPESDAIEWKGSPIGLGNTITRTKGRTPVNDKALDRRPQQRERLVAKARRFAEEAASRGRLHEQDVVIHGVRVRALTNSEHLADFWADNWFSPEQWRETTSVHPPQEPQVLVYALGGVHDEEEAAYYSRQLNTIVFFNTAYYGQLKSWVLGAVGRLLAEEYGIHSIHGACVGKGDRGVLYIAPTGTGKSTSSYGLMDYPDTRFHSDDWVYVRYTLRSREGLPFAPLRVEAPQGPVLGYRCFPWLFDHRDLREVALEGITLSDQKVSLRVGDIDWEQPLEAYAYTSERIFYLRSNLVENFPHTLRALLESKLENVPDVSPEFLTQNREKIEALAGELQSDGSALGLGMSPEELRMSLARLFAFDNARAMLDILSIFEPNRVFTNPMEPLKLAAVFLLRREPQDSVVLRYLSLADFMTSLIIGQTPVGTHETAFNAYRAVDEKLERDFIEGVREEAEGTGRPFYEVYKACEQCPPQPDTLEQEFALFRLLHQAAQCYDMNTILARDPAVANVKEAVTRTMELLARVIDELPKGLTLTLGDYRGFVSAPSPSRRV
jgi:hypothetical protein